MTASLAVDVLLVLFLSVVNLAALSCDSLRYCSRLSDNNSPGLVSAVMVCHISAKVAVAIVWLQAFLCPRSKSKSLHNRMTQMRSTENMCQTFQEVLRGCTSF